MAEENWDLMISDAFEEERTTPREKIYIFSSNRRKPLNFTPRNTAVVNMSTHLTAPETY